SNPTAAQSSATRSRCPGSETAAKPWTMTRDAPASRNWRRRSARSARARATELAEVRATLRPGRRIGSTPDVDGHAEGARVPTDLLAARCDHREGTFELIGHHRVEVELIGEPR